MSFIHNWAIFAGIAAIGLPVAVHFLTRPRPIVLPLSTIRFVHQAIQQRRARYRLRDIVILALRTLAVALLAFAFARPLFDARPITQLDDSANIERVIILDVSQSMAAIGDGVAALDRARVLASKYLTGFGTQANLILAGARPEAIFDSPSGNLSVLKEALASAEPAPERIDVNGAIELAASMFSGSDNATKKELVIVSDFQRTNWAVAEFNLVPESALIQLESVAPESAASNVGIVDVRFSDRATVGGVALLEVVIANHGRSPEKVHCTVEMDDTAFVIEQICPPKVSTTLARSIEINRVGWQIGSAKLSNHRDALREDDSFPFVLQTEANSEFKLITRERSESSRSSSYFIQRALSPFTEERASGQPVVTRLLPKRMDAQSIGTSQLLIFDHPGKLQDAQVRLIASLLRRGRSVLYFASELIDANNLKLLYDAVGSDLQAPVEFLPPIEKSTRRDLAIATVQNSARPFDIFGDGVDVSLASLRFSGGLETRNLPDAIEEEVLARLTDQTALAFVSSVAAGNLCVFNADLNRSNLPNHPTFVPIMNELVDLLLDTGNRRQTAWCGEALTRLLPTTVTNSDDLVIEPANMDSTIRRSGEGVVWTTPAAIGPGIVRIKQKNELVYALSTNIPEDESDLGFLDEETMTQRLAGSRNVYFHSAFQKQPTSDFGWVWSAVAVVILMISEIAAMIFFKT